MKRLVFILLAFISLNATAQIYDTLPTGSKPYGNQLYISPAGLIIGGTGSAKFRVLGTKKYVDSLLALKVDVVPGKGLSTNDYTTAEKTKLSGIATGATANQTDAYLLSRSNHTGVQTQSTVTNLVTDLAGKEPVFSKNTAFNKNFGSGAGTVAEGSDSRILNGQTAFGWGNHATQGYITQTAGDLRYLRLSGGTLTGALNGTSSNFSTALTVGGSSNVTITTGDIKYNSPSFGFSIYPFPFTANRVQRYQDDDGVVALTKNYGSGNTIGANTTGNAATAIAPQNAGSFKLALATTLQDVTTAGNVTGTPIIMQGLGISNVLSYDTGIGITGTTSNHPLSLWANNAERARILPNGNILIGSTADNGSYKLQVMGGISATGNVGINGDISAANLSSSNYTATTATSTNISTVSNGTNLYTRVGNIVTVSGVVTATNTATGPSVFVMAVPVTSNFTSANDATGTVFTVNSNGGYVYANSGSNTVFIGIGSHTNNASKEYRFTFQYIIK